MPEYVDGYLRGYRDAGYNTLIGFVVGLATGLLVASAVWMVWT